jgi:pimeloyl-ACP methyl ester carboxylesterase
VDGSGSRRIEVLHHDGLRFDVLDSGPLDGPAVVLLHGFPERASHWDAVSRALHAEGFRTLAPDQRGYSPGARPPARSSYRIELLVGDVVALIEEYGAPVHLVGHDWGAMVAWTVAGRRPDLVRTLTTVSVPHPAAFTRSMVTSSQALRSWYVLLFQVPGLEHLARLRPRVVARALRGAGMTHDEAERFREEIVEYGALPGALGWYRALPWSRRTPSPRVRVPTTHVWSTGDTALARRGADLTAPYVRAPYELVVLEDVTHWIPTQAPDRLAEIILRRIASG